MAARPLHARREADEVEGRPRRRERRGEDVPRPPVRPERVRRQVPPHGRHEGVEGRADDPPRARHGGRGGPRALRHHGPEGVQGHGEGVILLRLPGAPRGVRRDPGGDPPRRARVDVDRDGRGGGRPRVPPREQDGPREVPGLPERGCGEGRRRLGDARRVYVREDGRGRGRGVQQPRDRDRGPGDARVGVPEGGGGPPAADPPPRRPEGHPRDVEDGVLPGDRRDLVWRPREGAVEARAGGPRPDQLAGARGFHGADHAPREQGDERGHSLERAERELYEGGGGLGDDERNDEGPAGRGGIHGWAMMAGRGLSRLPFCSAPAERRGHAVHVSRPMSSPRQIRSSWDAPDDNGETVKLSPLERSPRRVTSWKASAPFDAPSASGRNCATGLPPDERIAENSESGRASPMVSFTLTVRPGPVRSVTRSRTRKNAAQPSLGPSRGAFSGTNAVMKPPASIKAVTPPATS